MSERGDHRQAASGATGVLGVEHDRSGPPDQGGRKSEGPIRVALCLVALCLLVALLLSACGGGAAAASDSTPAGASPPVFKAAQGARAASAAASTSGSELTEWPEFGLDPQRSDATQPPDRNHRGEPEQAQRAADLPAGHR